MGPHRLLARPALEASHDKRHLVRPVRKAIGGAMTEAERVLREREHVAAQRHAGELLDFARFVLSRMIPLAAGEKMRRIVAEIEAEART